MIQALDDSESCGSSAEAEGSCGARGSLASVDDGAARCVLRARIVLLAAKGRSTRSIAREVGTMPRTVSQWRARFARKGLAGLDDKLRPGPAPKYTSETGRRILAVLEIGGNHG